MSRRSSSWSVAALMIVSIMLFPSLQANPHDDTGPDDAERIGPGSHQGHFPFRIESETHRYLVEVPLGQGLVIERWSAPESLHFTVQAPDGSFEVIRDGVTHYIGADRGGDHLLTIWAPPTVGEEEPHRRVAGTYYLFHLDIVDLPSQDDGGSGTDAGSAEDTATTLDAGVISGTIGGFDHRDVYQIDGLAGEEVAVHLPETVIPLTFSLQDGVGGVHGFRAGETARWVAQTDGAVYLDIRSQANSEFVASYDLEVVRSPGGPLSDLTVGAMTFEAVEGEPERGCYLGPAASTVKLSVDVVNEGDGPADAGLHHLTVSMVGTSHYACTWFVETEPLGPGERTVVELTFDLDPAAMQLQGEVRLDPRRQVQETDETNNHGVTSGETPVGSLLP